MQAPTLNDITQKQHLTSKAVDHSDDPDPIIYAPEDGTIDSYQQRGSGKGDAGNALRLRGKTGLHQFGHLEESYVAVGQKVTRGQKLAKMGYTGYTQPDNVPAGAHVHYWVLTNSGYVYPPTLYKEKFIKGDAPMKPTKSEVGNAFNYLGVRDEDVSKEDYNYYMKRRENVLYNNVLKALYTKYRKVVAQNKELKAQLATPPADVKSLKDKIIDFVKRS